MQHNHYGSQRFNEEEKIMEEEDKDILEQDYDFENAVEFKKRRLDMILSKSCSLSDEEEKYEEYMDKVDTLNFLG